MRLNVKRGNPQMQAGLCHTQGHRCSGQIRAASPLATYRIDCTTGPFPDISPDGLFLSLKKLGVHMTKKVRPISS